MDTRNENPEYKNFTTHTQKRNKRTISSDWNELNLMFVKVDKIASRYATQTRSEECFGAKSLSARGKLRAFDPIVAYRSNVNLSKNILAKKSPDHSEIAPR